MNGWRGLWCLAESAENAEMFGKLKLGKTLAESAENAEWFDKLKLVFFLAESAENADFTINF